MAHSTDGLCKQGQHWLEAEATQAPSTPPPPQPSQTRLEFVQSSDPLKLFRGQEPGLVGGRRLLSTPHMGAPFLPIRVT